MHHGFSNSLECWSETGYVDLLAPHFTIIMIDAHGHGSSGKPRDPSAYSLQNQVCDVIAVLDDMGVTRAHFYGYSLGGRVGTHWPVLGQTAWPRSRWEVPARSGALSKSAKGFLKTLMEGLEAYVAFAGSIMHLTDALRGRVLANDIDALIALWTQRIDEDVEFVDVLPALQLPHLLIAGSDDFAYLFREPAG